MYGSKKKWVTFLFIINIIILLVLVAGNFACITNPASFWPFSVAALMFPLLLLINLSFLIFWLFIKPVYSVLCLAGILLSIPQIKVSLPFNFSTSKEQLKDPDEFRVVTWNVNLMNYSAKDDQTAILENEKIFNTLYDLNADVICLQEFFTAVIPDKTYNFIDSFYNHLGYHYSYFSKDIPKFDGKFYSGTIIFSRYKIIDSSKILFPGSIAGSIIKTGIVFKNDTIDVVSTHMQNINFGRDEDKALAGTNHGFIERLKYGYNDQLSQVTAIRNTLNKCRPHVVFAGDLNDIPTSYTYNNIKRDLKDAWLEKGAGFGATYNFITHTVRIDYIFHSRSFKCMQTNRIISDASDHYGVVTDLNLIKQ